MKAHGKPRGSYSKGRAKRAEILSEAVRVFAESGYRGGSLKEIADRVGLSQAGYYNETVLFRVEPGFAVEGGDASGEGTGGRSRRSRPDGDDAQPMIRPAGDSTPRGLEVGAGQGLIAGADAGADTAGVAVGSS